VPVVKEEQVEDYFEWKPRLGTGSLSFSEEYPLWLVDMSTVAALMRGEFSMVDFYGKVTS